MRNHRLRIKLVVVVLIALITHVAPPRTRAQRSAVDTYAITGARIVPVSGQAIERGTVVIRNGLIVAVGAQVSAPADARVIDGT